MSDSNRSNGMGVTGFVLSIIGAVLFWIPPLCAVLMILAFLFSVTGFLIAIFSKRSIGFSIAGLIISILFFVLGFNIIVAMLS